MNIQVVVESEAAYRQGRSFFQDKGVTWYTTSPWLLENLPKMGEKVISPESEIRAEDAHENGELAVLLTERITRYIDGRLTDLPSGIKAGDALAESLFRSFAGLYYKAWLLEKVLDQGKKSRGETYVIGDPIFQWPNEFDVFLPRKATLFAILAGFSGCENLHVIPFKEKDWERGARKKMQAVGTSAWEKTMNGMNTPLSTLLLKGWRKIGGHREKRDDRPREKNVWILKENSLIEEASMPLRLRGLRVRSLPAIQPADSVNDETAALGTMDQFSAQCQSILSQTRMGGCGSPLFEGATKLAASLTMNALRFARGQAKSIEAFVEREITANIGNERPAVLTNALRFPRHVMFYHGCKHWGVPVLLVSHGVAAGLSQYHDRLWNILSFSHGDVFLGYSEGECRSSKAHSVAGAPVSERSLRGKKMQRLFARRRLGVPSGKRLVMYVANLYSNNDVDLPYGGTNDWFEHRLKKTMIHEVFSRLSDHCVVKLYPTQRYADPDPFMETEKPSNVHIVQWAEFRYLRSACDVLVVDMAQSAFGWAWSAGVPLILLTTPYYPLLPDVLKDLKEALFVVSTDTDLWVQELLSLLRLPHRELESKWRAKDPVRRRTETERILGPQTKAGRTIVQTVMRERKSIIRRPRTAGGIERI